MSKYVKSGHSNAAARKKAKKKRMKTREFPTNCPTTDSRRRPVKRQPKNTILISNRTRIDRLQRRLEARSAISSVSDSQLKQIVARLTCSSMQLAVPIQYRVRTDTDGVASYNALAHLSVVLGNVSTVSVNLICPVSSISS